MHHARAIEDRLRAWYIRRVPRAVATRLDGPLRTVSGHTRRMVAWPFYLRQELRVWRGLCAKREARIKTWARRSSPHLLFRALWDAEPAAEELGTRRVTERWWEEAPTSDAEIAETTPVVAPRFSRAGFLIVPALVRMRSRVADVEALMARPGKSLGSDLRGVAREALECEVLSYREEISRDFFYRYYEPYLSARFAGREDREDFATIDRLYACGYALAVRHPSRPEPVAIALCYERGDALYIAKVAVYEGDGALLRLGALSGVYVFAMKRAIERRYRFVDLGRNVPWLRDGVTAYKRKWGARPVFDPSATYEYAIRVSDSEHPIARRMRVQQLVIRTSDGFRYLSPGGMESFDATSPPGGVNA